MNTNHHRSVVATLLILTLLVAAVPVAGQTVIEKHEDSANDHDFTTVSDGVLNVTSDTTRWDAGYKIPSGEAGLRTTASTDLVNNGDWSLVVTFIPNGTGDRALFAVEEVGGVPTRAEHFAFVNFFNEVKWCWAQGGTSGACVTSSTGGLSNGELYSAWIRFDQGGTLSSSVAQLKVFNGTGVELSDDTESAAPDMTFNGKSADVIVSDIASENKEIQGTELYELRLWHQLVSATTLDAIAGAGGDTTWARELEGTEQAAWFMEEYLVGEAAGGGAQARVIAEATSSEVTVTAWLENPDHHPANAHGATVAIVELDGTDPAWWNQTTQEFQAKATNVTMTQVEPWWTATLTAPPAGTYTVVTWLREDGRSLDESEQTTVTVPEAFSLQAIEIQSLDQNTLVYITGALIALFVAVWMGWIFSGVAAIFAVIDGIMRAHTDFTAWSVEASIVLYTLAIIPHWIAHRMEAERERRPDPFLQDLEQEAD